MTIIEFIKWKIPNTKYQSRDTHCLIIKLEIKPLVETSRLELRKFTICEPEIDNSENDTSQREKNPEIQM